MPPPADQRQAILEAVRKYATAATQRPPFAAGSSTIAPAGKVLGAGEFVAAVDAILDGWLTGGRFNDAFEARLAAWLGIEYVLTCNSGSSANLLALTALTSPQLGARALRPGDEVITAAAGFPTTINPILQNGLVPVFVDSHLPTYNPDVEAIAAAIGPRTRAIMIAHTLGNPFPAAAVREVADRHGLWLIEDCCDALGSTLHGRKVGSFGHLGTLSFYPAHHITMGEGGAVFTADPQLQRIVASLRDWGRDCWCATGCDNTCGRRYDWQLGDLPAGYDHKYVYSHAGYNLKITDMQAAIGLAQLDRLDGFVAARRANFRWLHHRLQPLHDILVLPQAEADSDPSWFGFPITLDDAAAFDRVDLLRFLDQRRIGTRLLFAGNVLRQPYFAGRAHRVSGELATADRIMQKTFWVGVWPGLDEAQLDYIATSLADFCGIDL
ncbi:MAG: lipopolysaccharide biosynthesis protein RfbH [Candidatus Accumulibacter sp.]|uniref:lipopolysaccharide biosynthesis protein RfbH n=1 Tax=Accumulibacter sp. TaxID=2053492 RepID=UPI00287A8668|nr:lipopolysaccharide biosynthesis protein RfbH [Accumulibacter sp.]MDS4013440.1 lipopolysaccharide biosynthesis protein RfbH [Accumulibacter sp.]